MKNDGTQKCCLVPDFATTFLATTTSKRERESFEKLLLNGGSISLLSICKKKKDVTRLGGRGRRLGDSLLLYPAQCTGQDVHSKRKNKKGGNDVRVDHPETLANQNRPGTVTEKNKNK